MNHNLRRINEKGMKGLWRCIECGTTGDFKTVEEKECKPTMTFEERIQDALKPLSKEQNNE